MEISVWKRHTALNLFPQDWKTNIMHDKVKGLSCQMWTEWISNVDRLHYMAFPRTCAYAEVGWSQKGNKDFSNFNPV